MKPDMDVETILALQKRWNRIRIANLYDALDKMEYFNQCLDLGIRPLFPHTHLAGMAVTVRGARDPVDYRALSEEERAALNPNPPADVRSQLFPGAAVVVDGGGERLTGKFGEMTSWGLKQHGAMGMVLDGYIRDWRGLEVIPDYTVCSRGTSPIESARRWKIAAVNVPISMPGTLTEYVTVTPGDWVVGGMDGVIVVPQAIADEVLVKAEEIEDREEGMRQDMAAGMTFADGYKKWGRA
jgi:4-hydroxy-4-methyl-2-oxoglutarate aldolase